MRTFSKRHFGQLLLTFLLLMMTGCGFHLRGMSDFPTWLDNIGIVIQNANPDLASLLQAQFQYSHRTINNDISHARYLLIIEGDDFHDQITNVSASTTPRLFLLTYTIKFSLVQQKGKPIIASNTVKVTRQLTINNNRLLGSDLEEAVLKNEMRKEAVIQLINRLNIKRSPAQISS